MGSQYRPEARLLLVFAAVVYASAVAMAPALHFAEEWGPHAHAAQLAGSEDPVFPVPVPGDPQDELDCLFCQALSHQAHPSSEVARIPVFDASLHFLPERQGPPHGGSSHFRDARAPPRG